MNNTASTHNVIEALETIRARAGGLLRPSDVVEHAKDEESPLHEHFEWDDTEAAQEYRLYQARVLIQRIKITKPAGADEVKRVRMYVSLSGDRGDGGGYREIDEVLADEERRQDLLSTALGEFQALKRKYNDLAGLEPVFSAIDDAVAEHVAGRGGQGKARRDVEGHSEAKQG